MGNFRKQMATQRQAARVAGKAAQAAARRADIGGRLLAAEAEYLTFHGWVPSIVRPRLRLGQVEEVPSTVYWSYNGTTLKQGTAVMLQKAQDPHMAG